MINKNGEDRFEISLKKGASRVTVWIAFWLIGILAIPVFVIFGMAAAIWSLANKIVMWLTG